MVNKRVRLGAALCASLLIFGGTHAAAEEKRIGDLIYVPAMTVQAQAGTYSLRVEGLSLGEESDDPISLGQVAGAEFGVYVVSSSGELTPWANPLYPSEPMRIRTGEGETRFSLPSGTEFFLRQERAPEGYRFDSAALIAVEGEEIVVSNSMAGQLLITAQDSLGNPVAGTQFTVTEENGTQHILTADEQGEAVLLCEKPGVYDIVESVLPEGAFDAINMNVGREADFVRKDAIGMAVRVSDASRTRVTFEHPASGSVQLNMRLAVIDDLAQFEYVPLEGVRMDILGQWPQTLLTDETGSAKAALLEGEYTVRLHYEGDAILPVSEGMMIVESGATTLIELDALQTTGRIALEALSAKAISGGNMTIVSDANGETFGPYALDEEGIAVSQALTPGLYHLSVQQPADAQVGALVCGENSSADGAELVVEVRAGTVTGVQAQMLTKEKQTYEMVTAQVGETGEVTLNRIDGAEHVQLIAEDGTVASELTVENGQVSIEALSGTYTLRLEENQAEQFGVMAESVPFTLPAEEESIVFASTSTRLVLTAVSDLGTPITTVPQALAEQGAVYTVVDSTGKQYEVAVDENGEAVTPLMRVGEIRIETAQAPMAHTDAEEVTVTATAGEATRVQIVHERYGTAKVAVQEQRLDERGEAARHALSGMGVEILRAQEKTLAAQLLSGEDGFASVQLEAGDYIAVLDGYDSVTVPFTVENTKQTDVALLCYDDEGGLRIELTGGELTDTQRAQVRFELIDQNGTVKTIRFAQDEFYLGGIAPGTHTLRQTQMPEGYTLGTAHEVTIYGGQLTVQPAPLEEYAVLSVSKTGLTFNDRMQTFVVPLTGQFGVYTSENNSMKPYPSEQAQMTVWSNVTPNQIEEGKLAEVKLPAQLEGTTYYIKELSSAQGFAQDDVYHELVLTAGEKRVFESTVSSDRGFFSLDQLDAVSGEHVSGGHYELLDAATLESVLAFEMGEAAYRNPMAIGVGKYLVRQTKAAPGYAMSTDAQLELDIEPYLTQGGHVTDAVMTSVRIPADTQMNVLRDFYAAQEQGLTLVSVDTTALGMGERLILPQLTLSAGAVGAERSDIKSVQIVGTSDAVGTPYAARVEYCLSDGGWQPSDARTSPILGGPVVVSLSDVEDDISAVRITYFNAETDEEIVGDQFVPGLVTLDVRVSAEGPVEMAAEATFTGKFAYTQAFYGELMTLERSAEQQIAFTTQGSGVFATAPAGRDGRITGTAFFDVDADGVIDGDEASRYAGMNVSLLTRDGDVVATSRTDGQGGYSFDTLSAGIYTVEFDAGEEVVFSSGSLYSAQRISSVADKRYGLSDELVIDAEHTDYVVNAGCLYAASVSGGVLERLPGGEKEGFGGLAVEMRRLAEDDNDEPVIVVTSEMGEFRLGGILPGRYEVKIVLPEGYLSPEAESGILTREIEFAQGDQQMFGLLEIERGAKISGQVRIDENGDGLLDAQAKSLADVTVKLLQVEDGHTQTVAQTQTDAEGQYTFDMLASGDYSVLFELPDEWAFTRYSEDSKVYGAAAASGSTERFALEPGSHAAEINAGVTIPASLAVHVFKDSQFDGQKGVYEEMLAGVSVSLIRVENGEDVQEMTVVTAADGIAAFDHVSPGDYVLAYQMPDAWRTTKQVDPTTTNYPVSCVPQSTLASGRSGLFSLAMGQKDAQLYIGAMLSGSISGRVYFDDNADAKLGDAETYVVDASVELLNAQGEWIAQSKSDENGTYAFDGLAPGRYRVRFTAQEGCGFAATERTMARGGVQESDENIASTRVITLESGASVATADAGVVRLGMVGGVIWEDCDADRATADDEHMLSGVEVALMNGTGRNILRSTVTDEHGMFAFENMRPGQYLLRVSAPDGYVFSGEMADSVLPVDNVRENRAYTSAFALLGGAKVDNIGYGLYTQGEIQGLVWQDADFDAVKADAEEGLRGTKLELIDASGEVVATTTSQRSGEFAFNALAPGEYTLRATLSDGFVFTREGGASVMAAEGESEATLALGALQMGQTISGIHIGALRPADVSGVIWLDQDDDGRRQVNDAGMDGLKVQLIDVQSNTSFAAYTNETGAYRFEGVLPGEYRLAFELPEGHAFARKVAGSKRVSCVEQVDALNTQSDVFSVTSGVNVPDMDVGVVGVGTISGMIWEDSAYNGKAGKDERRIAGAQIELIDAKNGAVVSSAFSNEDGAYIIDFVRVGEYCLKVSLPDGMIFTREGESAIADVDATTGKTANFAFEMGEHLEEIDFGAIAPAKVSGSLYVDEDESGTHGAMDTGLRGAVVTMMQGGTVVATCETDVNGEYALDTMRPGTYRIRMTLPEETLFVEDVHLKLESPDALEGETGEFEVTMGQQLRAEDVGTVRTGAIRGSSWADDDADGKKDSLEKPLIGTMAELLAFDEQGSGVVIAQTQVDAEGRYSFDMLRSGVYAVRFTLPEGMLFADQSGEAEGSSVTVVPGNIGMTDFITMGMGEKRLTVNIGGILPGAIGDTVWLDRDGNGLQDYREELLPGVTLSLMRVERDGSAHEAARTVSDQYGYYRFEELRPGTYVVRVQIEPGDTLTFNFGEPLGEIDSDIDPETAESAEILLHSGENLRNIDVGFTEKAE